MIERNLAKNISDALGGFAVVYVNGPRQAGKSTLVQSLAGSDWPAEYVTFNAATTMGAAEANPESFCGIVLYRGNRIIAFEDNMWAVPVEAMWT